MQKSSDKKKAIKMVDHSSIVFKTNLHNLPYSTPEAPIMQLLEEKCEQGNFQIKSDKNVSINRQNEEGSLGSGFKK